MLKKALLIVCCVASLASAYAAPAKKLAADDIEKYLADRGVLAQVEEMRSRVGDTASDLVVNAMGFLGVPYRRGGNTVESGLDCSGFTRLVFLDSNGIDLPRTAAEQAHVGTNVSAEELKPGDLVFFNTMRRAYSHVGIYLGNNQFVHAPKPGAEIRVENMQQSYWVSKYNGARRLDGVTAAPSRALSL